MLIKNTFDSKGIPLLVPGVSIFGENVPTILCPAQVSFAMINNLDIFKHVKQNRKLLKIKGVRGKSASVTKFK